MAENTDRDKRITDSLYGGDQRYRLSQEAVLGIGGVRMLRALGYHNIERFHMNEGHSSLLTLELLDEEAKKDGRERVTHKDIQAVREKCIFTTHTPVPSVHDQFSLDMVQEVLGRHAISEMEEVFCCDGRLNMTYLQLIFSGMAHPQDYRGKEMIKHLLQMKESLRENIKTVYLENYDLKIARMMASGVDLWLSTPLPPLEASGTSGMKAAINGVPSLSVLDGWWVEGHIEGFTGWSIGEKAQSSEESDDPSVHASSLYNKLEQSIIPMFYQDQSRYIDVMLHTIALNGSFFNTHRMIHQYVLNAYFR